MIPFIVLAVTMSGCMSQKVLPEPTPLTHFTPSVKLQIIWRHRVGDGSSHYYYRLRPVVDQKVIFVASYNGKIVAFLAKNGRQLWQRHYPYTFTSGLGDWQHFLFVVSRSGLLLALDKHNGKIIWSVNIGSSVLAPPLVSNGIVLVNAFNGTLTAYRAKNGQVLWQVKQPMPNLILHLGGRPSIWQQHIICGFANGKMGLFNLNNGQQHWLVSIATPQGSSLVERMVDVDIPPLVDGHRVFIASYQGRLLALNLQNGAILWQHQLSAYAGMVADDHFLYVVAADGKIWAFDKKTGTTLWRNTQLAYRGISGPAIIDHYLAVGDHAGFIHLLSLADGHFVARRRINLTSIVTTPVVSDQAIYFYTMAGQLFAYRIVK